MTLLAVMARARVTQGAGSGVPTSGQYWAYLTGQVTSQASLTTGAAQSEPSGHLAAAGAAPGRSSTSCQVRQGAGCTQGAGGYQGHDEVRAPPGWGRVHIRVYARPG